MSVSVHVIYIKSSVPHEPNRSFFFVWLSSEADAETFLSIRSELWKISNYRKLLALKFFLYERVIFGGDKKRF